MWLYCVRHGESAYNAEGRIQGQLDVPLSEFGRRQGAAIAAALAALSADAIYSSPLLRAQQTAEIVARRLDLPIRTDERLKEINVGIFQGGCEARSPSGTRKRLPAGRQASRTLWFRAANRGGCSSSAVAPPSATSSRPGISGPQSSPTPAPHGRPGGLRPPRRRPRSPTLENASITTVHYDGDGRWELTAYNQIAHLAAVGLSGAGDL